mgnify:CR=1 FL=1
MNSPCPKCQMCCQSNTKPSQPAVFLTEKETISFGFATITYEKKDGVYKENISDLAEVSIGHSLITESLFLGLENTIKRYLKHLS